MVSRIKTKPLYERFQENVYRFLREKDMTQIELADRLNVHRSQITHVLRGNQCPSLEAVDRWAHALRVDPMALLA